MEKLTFDRLLKIDGKTLREICKIGQGALTCKFILCGKDGFRCAKGTKMQIAIEICVQVVQIAKGDNCPGMVRAN